MMTAPITLACSKSYSIIEDINSINLNTCQKWHDHLLTCVHCSLHYLIYAREKFNDKSYYQLLVKNPFPLSNRFLFQKFINNPQYFNPFFQYIGNNSLLELKKFTRKETSYSLNAGLAKIFLWLKAKNIRFIFMSRCSIELLTSLYRIFMDGFATPPETVPDPIFSMFIYPMFNVTKYIDKNSKHLRLFIRNLNDENKVISFSLLEIARRQQNVIINLTSIRGVLVMPDADNDILAVKEKNTHKCGNTLCKKIYLQNKYGFNMSYWNSMIQRKFTREIAMELHRYMKSRKVINKWYICSGCKCVKYCSRYCQKISWNKQNHAYYCRKIQLKPIY
eukprot:493575_1